MILVSACLAGFNVRYDGGNVQQGLAVKLVALGKAITVCPEIMAGFSTPREPAEIAGGTGKDVLAGKARVVNRRGVDVTDQYLAAAKMALKIAQGNHITVAFLKQKSPACGTRIVYNGHFSGNKVAGMGVTAALLAEHGIAVKDEEDLTIDNLQQFVDQKTISLLENNNLNNCH